MYGNVFEIITGEGLGVSYSSNVQIGSLAPTREFSHTEVKLHYNISTGNIHIKDHPARVEEANGPQEIGFILNSLAGTPATLWRLAVKKFKQLPPQNVVLIEEDGHETPYIYDSHSGIYLAPECHNGMAYLSSANREQKSGWVWYHPGTRITEYYDDQGNLSRRRDAEGRVSVRTSIDSTILHR